MIKERIKKLIRNIICWSVGHQYETKYFHVVDPAYNDAKPEIWSAQKCKICFRYQMIGKIDAVKKEPL